MRKPVKRSAAAILLMAGVFFAGVALMEPARAAETISPQDTNPVVVELFTSQGCNSCPPAEALLRELAEEDGIVALELHIDYWDYIGWPDPFASPVMTARQRSYVRDLQLRYVYTPQMVIDGRYNVVGSDRRAVRAAIEMAAADRVAVQVELSGDDGGKIIIPAGHAPAGGATIWLAIYDDNLETAVPSGENAGRTLKSRNVVRELVDLGTWVGEPMEIAIDLQAALDRGRAGCAVLLQQGETGAIIGAVAMPLLAE